jgi:hypothetical protein
MELVADRLALAMPWLAAAFTALSVGCATAPPPVQPTPTPSRPVVEFPSRETLSTLSAKAGPVAIPWERAAAPRDWTIPPDAPATSHGQRWAPSSPWELAFAEEISRSGRDLRLTRAMSCAASELGRFLLEFGTLPPTHETHFIVGACGGLPMKVGVQMLQGKLQSARARDDAALKQARHQMGPDLIAKIPAGMTEAGFSYVRRQKDMFAVVVFGQLEADVLPFDLSPDAQDQVVIEGEIHEGYDHVSGLVNVGRYGVADCVVDPSLRHPRFRFVCPVAPTDDQAWIQLFSARTRSVLESPFARLLVRRDRSKPLVFRTRTDPARPIHAREEFTPLFLQELNKTRHDAGFPEVRLSKEGTEMATGLAGPYFGAQLGEPPRPDDVETIARGLSAGWDVTSGMIRSAMFVSEIVEPSPDPGLWLETTVLWPLGRSTLLDPGTEEVAVGPVLFGEGAAVGAIVSGYRFYRGTDHSADVRTLLSRVLAARVRLKLPPPRLLDLEPVMRTVTAEVHAEKKTPDAALQALLEHAVQVYPSDFRGLVAEVPDLDFLELPLDVLSRPQLDLAVGITHHRPAGAAWGQMVVLVVFRSPPGSPAPPRTASVAPR